MAKADGEFKPKKVCVWSLSCRNNVLHIDFAGVLSVVIVAMSSRAACSVFVFDTRIIPVYNLNLTFIFNALHLNHSRRQLLRVQPVVSVH